uniref:Nucleophosmin n=1 Tax=Aotus nancymaae TaxID=37293 RepID=A0A2K5F773_AOTNA
MKIKINWCESVLSGCSFEQWSFISVHLLFYLSACCHPLEDSMDMDMSPLRPQNYLFSCELKADKDYHFKVDNDENEHYNTGNLKNVCTANVSLGGFEIAPPVVLQLKCGSGPMHINGQRLVAVEKDAESEDEEENVRLLSVSGKWSAPGDGSKVPQKKVKLAADEDDDGEDDDNDDDFDDEETEEKVPVKKSIHDTPAKNAQKSNQNGKDSKPSSTPRSKGQESFKKQEKNPKTPKGPTSVEDIRAKMQANIEKGDSLPKVEAKFINYVKNCFRMTNQEASQDLWQWRNLNNLLKIFHLISFL